MDVKEYSDFIKHRNNHWNNYISNASKFKKEEYYIDEFWSAT